jgi:hypothetical protein
MKNQQQVLLALLLLALTSMSAVAGGMNVAEPFFEEQPEDDEEMEEMPEMPEMDEQFAAAPGDQVVATPVDEEPKEEFVQNTLLGSEMPNVNADAEMSNVNVEGFTGGMYAGF